MAGVPPTGLVDRAYSVGGHATDTAAVSGDLPDRRGLIRALGIIQIVVGGICALMTAGMVFALNVHAGSIAYGVATVNLMATGIGSVRLIRSARRATIISAAIWLVLVGISLVAFFYMVVVQRGFGFDGRPLAMGLVFAGLMALFLVGLPVVLIAVYTRPSVRATFERNQAS
jgi:hypothetical protein